MRSRVRSGMDDGQKNLADLLKGPRIRFGEKSSDMPRAPSIYLVYEGNEPVYVGSSTNLRRRVFSQLFRAKNHYFASQMIEQRVQNIEKFQDYLISRCTVQWLATDGEDQAHWLERFVAGVIRPIYNGGSRTFQNSEPRGHEEKNKKSLIPVQEPAD